MRAVHATEFGGPEVLSVHEVPEPVVGPGQVVVDVAAADVMFLDVQLRSGWGTEFFHLEPPYVPGGAVAGVVVSVGPQVDPSWVGKRVVTDTAASAIGGGQPIGGYAEQALAKAETLVTVPEGLSLSAAVALAPRRQDRARHLRSIGLRQDNSPNWIEKHWRRGESAYSDCSI